METTLENSHKALRFSPSVILRYILQVLVPYKCIMHKPSHAVDFRLFEMVRIDMLIYAIKKIFQKY